MVSFENNNNNNNNNNKPLLKSSWQSQLVTVMTHTKQAAMQDSTQSFGTQAFSAPKHINIMFSMELIFTHIPLGSY